MDEVCDELTDIQQLEDDLSEYPNDDDDEEEDEEENDEEDDEDEDGEDSDDDDEKTFTSLNGEQVGRKPSASNGLDIAVKLEVDFLEDEENEHSTRNQQVNE